MTSTFAAQLRTIAAQSTNEFDSRARSDEHAKSLIFERQIAAKQDWATISEICLEGFRELCLLDSRLREFEQNLYSPQAKDQDRDQLTKSQNTALDEVIERCLFLLGAKLLLRPGVKAVEWLVRRFRVHERNAGALLATFLPYHETTIFRNLLSIVTEGKLVGEWKFLRPYHKDTVSPSRHAIVDSAIHNDGFFSLFNTYTLRVCQEGAAHTQLLRFWSTVVVEAITDRLKQVKSGRKEVQRQRTEDALMKILPLLNEGFQIPDCPDLRVACLSMTLVLAGNADLEDHVIDALTKAIAPFVADTEIDVHPALACIAILVSKKEDKRVPLDVLNIFQKAIDHVADLGELHRQVPVASLCEALVRSAVTSLKSKNVDLRIRFVEKVMHLAGALFEQPTKSQLLAVMLQKLQHKGSSQIFDFTIRTKLVQLLQKLNDSAEYSSAFAGAAMVAGLSQLEAEELLEGTIRSQPKPDGLQHVPMDIDDAEQDSNSMLYAAQSKLNALQAQSTERSFLIQSQSSLFDQLAQTFILCHRHEALLAQFEDLSLWREKTQTPSSLQISFLFRLALSNFPEAYRRAALQFLSQRLERESCNDPQLLVPYLTILLSDKSQMVRRAAGAGMLSVHKCLEKAESDNHQNTEPIYDALLQSEIAYIPPAQALKVLKQAYLPHLEECILDSAQMHVVLVTAFNGQSSTTSHQNGSMELKTTSKTALLQLMTECAKHCSLLKVQTAIIELLEDVHKVGNTYISKTLLPVLKKWGSLSDAEAELVVSSEDLSAAAVDATMVQLVMAEKKESADKETFGTILGMVEKEDFQPRSALIGAFFGRMVQIWSDVHSGAQITTAKRLFDMSFVEKSAYAAGSRGVLHAVSLSTETLAALLDQAVSGQAQMQLDEPPPKRRRTSHGRESAHAELLPLLHTNEARLTFALELVENSRPESHPHLLSGLFSVLIDLRRMKEKYTMESPYLLNLCLSCILAIVDKAQQSRRPDIDKSCIRADLVTDCVRSSENPQVQGTALLLSASLASLDPERILHTIMPIFTFTGNSILSKDDERSIYVTNRAIDEIIPPLVAGLKKQNARNLMHSTSNLLSSFVAAYEHVPQHRRLALYQRLLSRLGVDDFAFAIISLLASRKHQQDMSKFFTSLIGDLSASSQLRIFRKTIDLTVDIFTENPHNAEPLLDISRTTPVEKREREASILLGVSAGLLQPASLKTGVRRLSQADKAEQESFWNEFKVVLSRVLGMLKSREFSIGILNTATRKCLSILLELPSLADLLSVMPDLLAELSKDEATNTLQPLALRVLATQLQQNATTSRDSNTQTKAVSFLASLQDIIKTSEDESFRQSAIQCTDRIVEVYGRKNLDAVIVTLSCFTEDGNRGLGASNQRTQIMSLLCLATGMEVLKNGGVPIVLTSISTVLKLLKSSIGDVQKVELHDSCYTLLSSFITHVPFMISDENATEILEISYQSCQAKATDSGGRLDTLRLLATKLGLDSITSSLSQALKASISKELNVSAILELMDVLRNAIEHNSKSTVVKSADSISSLILQGLSLRHFAQQASSTLSKADMEEIQNKLNSLGIVFIYKLNDTTFRPIFESWVDWAVRGRSGDDEEAVSRLTSFFSFAGHFFETLKSIVTSYASYVLPMINDVLRSAIKDIPPDNTAIPATKESDNLNTTKISLDLADENDLALYKATLLLLTTLTTHDADSFFTTPTHFQPLATLLITQTTLLSTSTLSAKKSHALRQEILELFTSALISLATAVQDVSAHHHTLNHLLCQLRHSSQASVRLVSITSHIALTNSDVGEEWVQNVVLGHASAESDGAVGTGGSGETMVYVNEMLEDEDENVEMKVREWVRLVRERVGEDVFEV